MLTYAVHILSVPALAVRLKHMSSEIWSYLLEQRMAEKAVAAVASSSQVRTIEINPFARPTDCAPCRR